MLNLRMYPAEFFKYLQSKFAFGGIASVNMNIQRSALKPVQKLGIIQQYLLPIYIHCLHSTNVTLKQLKGGDFVVQFTMQHTYILPRPLFWQALGLLQKWQNHFPVRQEVEVFSPYPSKELDLLPRHSLERCRTSSRTTDLLE